MRFLNRAWLLLPAGLSMLVGLDAALLLLDTWTPVVEPRYEGIHGMIMVIGFLGTLIALERAVALRAWWGFSAPLLLGLGGIALAVLPDPTLGRFLLIDGSAAMVAVYAMLFRRQRDHVTLVEALGAVLMLGGAILWVRLDVSDLLAWLVGFIVLTICAERVELARLYMPPSAERNIVFVGVAVMVSCVVTLFFPVWGARMLGLTLVVTVAWLGRIDVARKTVKSKGLPRFSAAALLSGYVWLGLAGVVWLIVGRPTTIPAYDTMVHAVMLGFGMAMVMAHAPVILPAVLHRSLPYKKIAWLPLVVLHVGLVIRIPIGNGLENIWMWQFGGVLTVLGVLLLPITAAYAVFTAPKPKPRRSPTPVKAPVTT